MTTMLNFIVEGQTEEAFVNRTLRPHLAEQSIRADEIARLVEMAEGFDSPELIDDGDVSAPSKRIIGEIREYEYWKASAGPIVADEIGLDTLRIRCKHF